MQKEAEAEDSKRGTRELDRDNERVAVVCKRTCGVFLSRVSEWILQKCLEDKLVNVSVDESENWSEVCVCMLASVPSDFSYEHGVRGGSSVGFCF